MQKLDFKNPNHRFSNEKLMEVIRPRFSLEILKSGRIAKKQIVVD
jgi:hypothetical protein